jgi:hypothetical protein
LSCTRSNSSCVTMGGTGATAIQSSRGRSW